MALASQPEDSERGPHMWGLPHPRGVGAHGCPLLPQASELQFLPREGWRTDTFSYGTPLNLSGREGHLCVSHLPLGRCVERRHCSAAAGHSSAALSVLSCLPPTSPGSSHPWDCLLGNRLGGYPRKRVTLGAHLSVPSIVLGSRLGSPAGVLAVLGQTSLVSILGCRTT